MNTHRVHHILALSAALVCAPVLASAGERLNLAWNHCLGEGTGVQNASFACDGSTGSSVMTGSFLMGSDFPTVSGLEIVLDLASASTTLPAWWSL